VQTGNEKLHLVIV